MKFMTAELRRFDDDFAACADLIKEGVRPWQLGAVSDLPWSFSEADDLVDGRVKSDGEPDTSGSWLPTWHAVRSRRSRVLESWLVGEDG